MSYKIDALLGDAKPKAKKKEPVWKAGLDTTKQGWNPGVTTDLKTVKDRFLLSRRTGTYGATRRATPKTLESYESGIDKLFAYLRSQGVTVWEAVTRTHIQSFVASMNMQIESGAMKQSSVWVTFRTMRALFYFIEKQEDFKWESFRSSLPKIPKANGRKWIPSPAQVKQFLESFDQETIWGFRDYVMSMVMLDCGARVGELCNLTSSDILWDANMIVLLGKKRIGGVQVARKVSLSETHVMPLLKQWNRVREKIAKVDKFFVTRNGGVLEPEKVGDEFDKNWQRAGIETDQSGKITPHVFRHYFCTRYLVNGGKIENLHQITGHEELSTLMIYVHMAAELSHVQEEHRRVSPLDSLYSSDTRKKRKMF
jgi:integrase/recombinase XerD